MRPISPCTDTRHCDLPVKINNNSDGGKSAGKMRERIRNNRDQKREMTFCLICISFRFSQQAEKMRNHVVPLHGPKTVRDVYSVRCCTVCRRPWCWLCRCWASLVSQLESRNLLSARARIPVSDKKKRDSSAFFFLLLLPMRHFHSINRIWQLRASCRLQQQQLWLVSDKQMLLFAS
jgi:hypothetical protein